MTYLVSHGPKIEKNRGEVTSAQYSSPYPLVQRVRSPPMVVMGRDCSRNILSPSAAHSMSWGAPMRRWSWMPILATSSTFPRVREGRFLSASGTSTTFSPSGERNMACTLLLITDSLTPPSPASQTKRSGVTRPEAIDSPSPQLDSMIMIFSPETGSAVNMTPEESAFTMRCTITAIPESRWPIPLSCLYSSTLSFQ